jgi:hypothetical protein
VAQTSINLSHVFPTPESLVRPTTTTLPLFFLIPEQKKKGKVVVVGLTGPSGVGKTCLCDRLSPCLCKFFSCFFLLVLPSLPALCQGVSGFGRGWEGKGGRDETEWYGEDE